MCAQIVPNLHFRGDCAEAMAAYEKAFGAQITICLRYQDADPADFDEPLTDVQRLYVYHGEMLLCGQRIMMSDETEQKPEGRIPVSLCISMETPQAVQAAYAVLREGAAVIHPMQTTTYSGAFVSLRDRFGVRWELMVEGGQ